MLHAICSTLGHAQPGIDDYWSIPISGTIQLIDRHRVIESSYPPNMGTGYMGEEISATFNMPVDCDQNNGNYWFDVLLTQNGQEIPSTYYNVFCEDSTIYFKPTGNGVCKYLWWGLLLFIPGLFFSSRASSSTSTWWYQSPTTLTSPRRGPGNSILSSARVLLLSLLVGLRNPSPLCTLAPTRTFLCITFSLFYHLFVLLVEFMDLSLA